MSRAPFSASRRDRCPPAIVMGDLDLVRPLARVGIGCAVFGKPENPAPLSRHVRWTLPWVDHWERGDEVIDLLRGFAAAQAEAPVLFPQTDADVLLVSRHRERLGSALRFCLPAADLVEDLVDKCRFQELARRHRLPVPRSRCARPADESLDDIDLRFPVVVKPVTRRRDVWSAVEPEGKARRVGGDRELRTLWPQLARLGLSVILQEEVPGPEDRVESYHAYADEDGVVASFTGRKLRTFPVRYGYSSAIEITRAADVAALGETIVRRLGLRGVLKADFKRDPRGDLHLLEINPRFSLWHHPGALAGVNLPALVYADLTGRPRPPVSAVRPGVCWCNLILDRRAAPAYGLSRREWLVWLMRCDAVAGVSWDDPGVVVRGLLWPAALRRLRRRR